ncbi:MAG TPA: pyridoxamine 5'-phosphate oxidase [Flavobacteriaceae bacterium]|nr:pyridoxamine 5'-phosphate oxidase [Flavobacteriaceae bacterium]
MEKNLENYRRSYEKYDLRRENLEDHPIQQFQNWFLVAEADRNLEANAMTISSVGADGFPKSRVVLLKKYNQDGFVFFTNYESEKGKAILNNPKVCLSFFWPSLERQVIIKGTAEKCSDEISDAYFNSRPRGSRLSAVVSNQSSVIENRKILEDKLQVLEEKYIEKPVERPEFWGGFLVKPISIEFWQGRKNRLHDRFRYTSQGSDWIIERLAP